MEINLMANLHLRITDDYGAELPGVEVILIDKNSDKVMINVTNATGHCRFFGIPAGEYDLSFSLPGFSEKYLQNILIGPGESKNLQVNMSWDGIIKECIVVGPSVRKQRKSDLLREKIFDMIEGLELGQILFNPPKSMKLGVEERIEVRISQNINEIITKGLKGKGIPKIVSIKVSPVMSVVLSGKDFSIRSFSEVEQIISRSGFSQWEWDVTPLRAGVRYLYLSVSVVVIMKKYGEKKKSFPVIDKKIKVKVNLKYGIIKFIKKNWKWIIGTLIIPLIIFIYDTFLNK